MLFFVVGSGLMFSATVLFDHARHATSLSQLLPGVVVLTVGIALALIGLFRMAMRVARLFVLALRPAVVRLDIATPTRATRTVVRPRRHPYLHGGRVRLH
jgi:hypothetical protein